MTKRKRYTDEYRASAVVMLEAAGYPEQEGALSRVADHLGMHYQTLSRWFRAVQNPPPHGLVQEKRIDLRQAIRDELNAIFSDEDLAAVRAEASYKDRITSAAILTDKLQLLDGKPTERVEHLETMLETLPPDEYDNIIREAEAVIASASASNTGSGQAPEG